jgi:filamentous hemagglutinin
VPVPTQTKTSPDTSDVKVVGGHGTDVRMDGHKIYSSAFNPLSTNPRIAYRFSDPKHRKTGGDVYFGENIVTSYFEVRQSISGKSLFVGDVRIGNILDLTDPTVLRQMNIDPVMLTARMNNPDLDSHIYDYTNRIANQAYDTGYAGILYPSSRNPYGGNALILFSGGYNPDNIRKILDFQLKGD